MKAIIFVCSLSGCAAMLLTATANAQHHSGHGSGHGGSMLRGGHGSSILHGGGHGGTVLHHGSYFGHNDWNFVVPHRNVQQHHGSYYVHNDGYYYTPTPIVRIAPRFFQTVQRPPVQVVQLPIQLEFGGHSHVEDLSGRLATEANDLCLDMHYNYQQNPGFAETYREAYSLLDAAKFLYATENQADRDAVRQHVAQMHEQMHHVQGEIQQWSRQHVHQIASGGAIEKASSAEAVLHHLSYDVGIEPDGADERAPEPGITGEQAPAPGSAIDSPPPGAPAQ